jgi:hypothetical protein
MVVDCSTLLKLRNAVQNTADADAYLRRYERLRTGPYIQRIR